MPYTLRVAELGTVATGRHLRGRHHRGPATPIRDELDIDATNVSDVTVNARRARVTCNAQQNITSDGPITVHMVDCPAVPTLSVSDVSQDEGDSGTADMTFTVTLSGNTDNLPVSSTTRPRTAPPAPGSDYDAISGDLTFAPGETTKTINVPINGDTTIEDDETFTLQLSDVQFATPDALSATGTIVNDDLGGYPRPQGASPLRVSLVPAFEECAGAEQDARPAARKPFVQSARSELRPPHGRRARRKRPAREVDRMATGRRDRRRSVHTRGSVRRRAVLRPHRRPQQEQSPGLHRRARGKCGGQGHRPRQRREL